MSEPLLFTYVISIKFSCSGSFHVYSEKYINFINLQCCFPFQIYPKYVLAIERFDWAIKWSFFPKIIPNTIIEKPS